MRLDGYGVERVGIGKEVRLDLRRNIMLVAVSTRQGKCAVFIREECLGRLVKGVPTIAMTEVCAKVDTVVVEVLGSLCLPVVLIVVRAILTLAIAVNITVHSLSHGSVDVSVGIVGLGIYHLRVVVAKLACPYVKHISLLCLVLRLNLSIPFVEESRLYLYVKHLVFFSLIATCMARQFRLAVVQLNLVSHLSRKFSHYLVATKQVLAIHHKTNRLIVPI